MDPLLGLVDNPSRGLQGWREAGRCCETCLSQGLPKAHTPAVQGPRVRSGKQLLQCPGLTWGHMRASPAGASTGVGAATRSRDAGKPGHVGAENCGGLGGGITRQRRGELGVPSECQDPDGGNRQGNAGQMTGPQKEGWMHPSAPPPSNTPWRDRWVLSSALTGAGMRRGEQAQIWDPSFILRLCCERS